MQSFFPSELVSFVQGRIDDARSGKQPPISAWQDCRERLEQEKVARKEVHLPDEVMVHPCNRGGLGVNAYNVHRTGKMIHAIGCDISELERACAFERLPMEPQRSKQTSANEKLIAASKGMLAPLSGAEKLCSVGTGHTTQFFKAAKAGCKTPEANLADSSGKLNCESLGRDARFQKALQCGWTWTVLPWQAEVVWPLLPDLAQRALNASQNVACLMSELEVCVTIAEFAELKPKDSSFQDCVDAVAQNEPPCSVHNAKG